MAVNDTRESSARQKASAQMARKKSVVVGTPIESNDTLDVSGPTVIQPPSSQSASDAAMPKTAEDCAVENSQLQQWQQHLSDRFGLKQFRDGQLAVITRLMQGRSAAAIFPTGGGKSLCYQFPASLLDGLTLVVSPLLALMREQVEYLNQMGIAAYRLDSSQSPEASIQVTQALRTGTAKILYVAPERFFNERFRELIEGMPIALFAIDEAHCISQWGHNFRPDYLKLASIARQLNAQRILALTATATPAVLTDICSQFSIAAADAVRTPFFRANLSLTVALCDAASRRQKLLQRLSNDSSNPAIVYVTLQKTAEEVAEFLLAQGLNAKAYHAGLDDLQRQQIQDWFMQSQQAIVVATIAFGMGIDKANIRSVIHYNPSKSLESFAQEIGRAGRDGLPAICETLLVPEDRVVLENFAYGDTPSLASLLQFVQLIAGQPTEFFISYYALSYDTDIRDSVIRTLMTNLELRGLLQSTVPRYELYKFKPKVNSAHILNQFEGERRQFAGSVLAMAVKKRVWCEVNATHAATRLKTERLRVVRMLEYFHQQQWIELETSGVVHGYRRLRPIDDVGELTQSLRQYVMQRESGELARLNQLYELFGLSSCQSVFLSQHFGDVDQVDCGHCSACRGSGLNGVPQPKYPQVGDSARTAVSHLQHLHPDLLTDSHQQAKFLCGLSSPKFTRARLSRDSAFGCCSHIPLREVIQSLQSH